MLSNLSRPGIMRLLSGHVPEVMARASASATQAPVTSKSEHGSTTASKGAGVQFDASNASNNQQRTMNTSFGRYGYIAAAVIALYAGYKMMGGRGISKKTDDYHRQASAGYQIANDQRTDTKK